jgi:hypothetical protein
MALTHYINTLFWHLFYIKKRGFMRLMHENETREILFELFPMGPVVKVVAIDAKTGVEVSIQGPASAGETMLKQTAMRKLLYVLNKKKS